MQRQFITGLLSVLVVLSLILSGCSSKSDQQVADEYKKTAVKAGYKDILRNPDQFKGKPMEFSGTVTFVKETNNNVELMIIVGKEGMEGQPIWATYAKKEKQERIIENDQVRVWGELEKIGAHQPNSLLQINSPDIAVKYIERLSKAASAAKPAEATQQPAATSAPAAVATQPDNASSEKTRPLWTMLGPSRWEGGQGNLKVRFQIKSQDGPVVRGVLEHIDGKVASADIMGAINEQGGLQFTYTDSWGNKGKGMLVVLSRDTMVIETSETSRAPTANMYLVPGQFTLKRQ